LPISPKGRIWMNLHKIPKIQRHIFPDSGPGLDEPQEYGLSFLLPANTKVHFFPAIDPRPIEGKKDRCSGRQVLRRKVGYVYPQSRVPSFRVLDSMPTVGAPMNHRRRKDLQA
jgi:hypothetical protein